MSVEIRPVEPGDCARIPAFRGRMEGGGYLEALRDEAFYRDKYLARGRALVAVEGADIVGIIAATPRMVRLGETAVQGAEVGDLFVDPSHRGRGLFRKLHDGLLGLLQKEGVHLLTVRPGPEAEPILRRAFGYRTLFGIAEWVAALDDAGTRALPLGRVPVARLLLPKWRRSPVDSSGPVCRDAESSRLAPPDAFGPEWPRAGTVRDAEWLRARFVGGPTPYRIATAEREGRTTGVLVRLVHRATEEAPARGWIVDGWTAPGDVPSATALLRHSLEALRAEGASIAHFWSAKEAPRGTDTLTEALRHGGFRAFRRGKLVVSLLLGDAGKTMLPGAADWMFRMGDTDGI